MIGQFEQFKKMSYAQTRFRESYTILQRPPGTCFTNID